MALPPFPSRGTEDGEVPGRRCGIEWVEAWEGTGKGNCEEEEGKGRSSPGR